MANTTDALEFDYYCGQEADQFTFVRVPWLLLQNPTLNKISGNAKLLYGLMLNRMSLSIKNDWLDADGHAFICYSADDICADLNCSERSAKTYRKELEKVGLIEINRLGQGKLARIYVKKFIEKNPRSEQKCKNCTSRSASNENGNNYLSRSAKVAPLEVQNLPFSNNKVKKKELNNNFIIRTSNDNATVNDSEPATQSQQHLGSTSPQTPLQTKNNLNDILENALAAVDAGEIKQQTRKAQQQQAATSQLSDDKTAGESGGGKADSADANANAKAAKASTSKQKQASSEPEGFCELERKAIKGCKGVAGRKAAILAYRELLAQGYSKADIAEAYRRYAAWYRNRNAGNTQWCQSLNGWLEDAEGKHGFSSWLPDENERAEMARFQDELDTTHMFAQVKKYFWRSGTENEAMLAYGLSKQAPDRLHQLARKVKNEFDAKKQAAQKRKERLPRLVELDAWQAMWQVCNTYNHAFSSWVYERKIKTVKEGA